MGAELCRRNGWRGREMGERNWERGGVEMPDVRAGDAREKCKSVGRNRIAILGQGTFRGDRGVGFADA